MCFGGSEVDGASGVATSFGFEAEEMAFERFADCCTGECVAFAADCVEEIFDKFEVGSRVEGLFGYLGKVDDVGLAFCEFGYVDFLAVADDFAFGHLDVGGAAVALSEDVHTQCDQRAIGHLHREHLIVDHVVVAVVDAAAVVALVELLVDDIVESLSFGHVEVVDPLMAAPVEVDGGEGAVFFYRAVDAALGRALRSVFAAEPQP